MIGRLLGAKVPPPSLGKSLLWLIPVLDQESKGWITIGGHKEGDKEHVDGTAVNIDQAGVIRKGPKELKGSKLKPPKVGPSKINKEGGVKPPEMEGGSKAKTRKEEIKIEKERQSRLPTQQLSPEQIVLREPEEELYKPEEEQYKNEEPIARKKKLDMREGSVTSSEKLDSGYNASYIVELDNGYKGVFKPRQGEDHSLRKSIRGRYYIREAAAADIGAILGMEDLVPTTIIRDGPNGVGSFQQFKENAMVAKKLENIADAWDGEEDLSRSAAFDYLVGNSDRHGGNWMVDNESKELVLIDNGLSFPDEHGMVAHFLLINRAIKHKMMIPDEVKSWEWNKIEDILTKYKFKDKEVALTKDRFDSLVLASKIGGGFKVLPKIFIEPDRR